MTIRTNKMLAARTDHYGRTCKLWFPCNEGSGNSITDAVSGVVITDAATAEHNEPNAISIITAAPLTGTGISNVQIPKVGIAMAVFRAHAVAAISTITLGGSSTTGILLGTASNSLTVNEAAEANAPVTAVSGSDYVVHAIAWDSSTGYCYFDSAATKVGLSVTLESSSSIDPLVYSQLPRNFDSGVTISAINPIDIFGIAMFGFDGGLPSDTLTGIRTMAANWLKGEKTLYAPWANL